MNIWLLQKITVADTLPTDDEAILSDIIERMHYMGAAEYEFGAMPESLRRMHASKDDASIYTTDIMDSDGKPVLIYHSFTDGEELAEYVKQLKAVFTSKHSLKSSAHFAESLKGNASPYVKCNLWWDLGYDTMITTRKDVMEVVQNVIGNSVCMMDKRKAERDAEDQG
jgi:hypothetical protein